MTGSGSGPEARHMAEMKSNNFLIVNQNKILFGKYILNHP